MSQADIDVVMALMRPVYDTDLIRLQGDEEGIGRLRAHMEPRLHPDFEIEVVRVGSGRGAQGFPDIWAELLSVFAAYHPRLGEAVDAGDGRVALFGHDEVVSHEGIELHIPVGAIYEVRDGLARRAVYYPEQGEARERIRAQ